MTNRLRNKKKIFHYILKSTLKYRGIILIKQVKMFNNKNMIINIIKDLNLKQDTLTFIEEKVGKSLPHMGRGEIFLNRTTMAYALRSTNNKWDYLRLQSFCKSKDSQ